MEQLVEITGKQGIVLWLLFSCAGIHTIYGKRYAFTKLGYF